MIAAQLTEPATGVSKIAMVAPVVAGLVVFSIGVAAGYATPPEDWAIEQTRIPPVCIFIPASVPSDESPAPPCNPTVPALDRPPNLPQKLVTWWQARDRVRQACAASKCRQRQLETSLVVPEVPHFAEARHALEEERAAGAALAAREKRLQFGTFDLALRAGLGAIDAAVAVAATLLLLSTSKDIARRHGARTTAGLIPVYATFVAIGWAAALATMRWGGVDVDDKMWVGTDSYVVSPPIWWWTFVSMAGVGLMFAQPMSLLWLLSRDDLVPKVVDPEAPDGECGVGEYVSFLQLWTMLGFGFVLVPSILWIRFAGDAQLTFQPGYWIPPLGGMGLTSLLVYRLVRNSISLRSRYKSALAALAPSWLEVQALKPGPDPTIVFIGENWWKLPATLGSILLAIWAVLEKTGAAQYVTELLH